MTQRSLLSVLHAFFPSLDIFSEASEPTEGLGREVETEAAARPEGTNQQDGVSS